MGIEIGMTENVCSPVVDRVEELRDDMEDGFSDLRSKVQEMDANELRREMSLLMMIGNSQIETVHRLRREVEEMDRQRHRFHDERVEFQRAARELVEVMGIPFDPDNSSPAKLVRTAATVAGKYAERHMPTDKSESRVEVVAVVAFSAFVLCVVVLTALMVSTWVL